MKVDKMYPVCVSQFVSFATHSATLKLAQGTFQESNAMDVDIDLHEPYPVHASQSVSFATY